MLSVPIIHAKHLVLISNWFLNQFTITKNKKNVLLGFLPTALHKTMVWILLLISILPKYLNVDKNSITNITRLWLKDA